MNPWDAIRRAAADRSSGSVVIARRAARGLAGLETRKDVVRAARALLDAHPAMGALWRLLAAAYSADSVPAGADGFRETLEQQTASAADGVRWAITKRSATVITCSSSNAVVEGLRSARGRIDRVLCAVSLPGGEGRRLATRLRRDGFTAEVVPDAGVAAACARADLALVGADAVTGHAVINKVGTMHVALGALEAGIGCYALATETKVIPHAVWESVEAPAYEATPLRLFDGVLTERGSLRTAAIRRTAERVTIPRAIRVVVE